MALSLEVTAGPNLESRVRLLEGDCELASLNLEGEEAFARWEIARQAMERHNWAVARARAARMPGVLPLPPDHVPAAEHFMVAVYALFPGFAVANAATKVPGA